MNRSAKKYCCLAAVFFFIALFLNSNNCTAQDTLGYTGILVSKDKKFMPYELKFVVQGRQLKGTSLSDKNGKEETLAEIVGIYDEANKKVQFSETKVLSSKSKNTTFCLLKLTGKVVKQQGVDRLTGTFTGTTSGSSKDVCAEGIAELAKTSMVAGLVKKLMEQEEVKTVTDRQVTDVKLKPGKLLIRFFDAQDEDGDVISIFIDDKPWAMNKEVKSAPTDQTIHLKKGQYMVKVVAENQGAMPPNTAKVVFQSAGGQAQEYVTTLQDKSYCEFRLVVE